ncbi:cation diffusion facilitator family transporter [Falsiroseomonas selenitidurans]|uniref:Cation transporter n=1 Tax=Falsiroseomonas selenitidurans TaxID=2716335 RepID=A0ABX1EAC6_9PROT|nr:cation diffusion facilitator family transporter [Falsiroseomonas selenitidurans]NKC31885.1 cation transporter [Falsiroseomonas selenitidurans]
MGRAQDLAAVSVGVAMVVLGLKVAAWWVTGSVALYADALESVVNVAAAIAALLAIRFAARPPDADHPYGHAKAEYVSAVLEGVLICVAALLILSEAWQTWQSPRLIEQPGLGVLVSAVATALNGSWSWVLFRRGRSLRSPALLADARHLLSDVVTSGGVLVGVLLVALTGLLWMDPLLAALTALNILVSGWRLIRESFGGLMDEAAPAEELGEIRALVAAHAEGAIEAHDLRTRRSGPTTFVEFHLVVPGSMTVTAAHDICDRIEMALKAHLDSAVITIHVEPDGKAKHRGVLVL